MLEVSFIGKKFTCEANFEVADEIGADGLKLNLKVRETSKHLQKPAGPVLATLHVSVNNGRRNDVTKCKELLTFLKEQVLPKTIKLISLKTIKKVKDEETNEGRNLLSCIWPGKSKKRKDETKNCCSRGYSSDTEGHVQKSFGPSNIKGKHQVSNAGILATPLHSRIKLTRGAKLKANQDDPGDKQKNSPNKKIRDKNTTFNQCLKTSQRISLENDDAKITDKHVTAVNKNTKDRTFTCSGSTSVAEGTGNDRAKVEHDQIWFRREVGLQRVQNGKPDSSELKISAKSNCSTTQEALTKNKNSCDAESCKVRKSAIEIFAADFVSRIFECALSRKLEEKSHEVAKNLVADVVSMAKCRIMGGEQLQCQRENSSFDEVNGIMQNVVCEECPSFSKVWKYSQIFSAEHEHEIPLSLRVKHCSLKHSERDACTKLRVDKDSQVINGYQSKELNNKVLGSTMSSNNSLTETSSNLSSHSMELHKLHTKAESFSACEIDSSQSAEDIIAETGNSKREPIFAKGTLDASGTINANACFVSIENGELSSENCNACDEDVLFTEKQENNRKELENSSDNDFCNKGNEEDGETAKTQEELNSTNVSAEDLAIGAGFNNGESLQSGTKSTGKFAPKQQENGGETTPSKPRIPLYQRAISESQASERRQWCPTEPGDEDLQTSFYSFHSSCRTDLTASKFARSSSCPVVSEDDVLIESMLSHHEDVYESLAKRTWIIVHVHELWNGGKPMDAIKTCIEMTGMADVEKDLGTATEVESPYMPVSRDYALFLNILQQLPSSCSMWSLDLCVLVLPKLKGFISNQHRTSHVEMASSVIHVVLKKVSVVVRRLSKGNKNKEKEQKVKFCTNELKEIKDMTDDVIQTVKSNKKINTEDPGSMKQVLKELQLALGTFLSITTTAS